MLRGDTAIGARLEIGDAQAARTVLRFQIAAGVEHAFVLGLAGDDVGVVEPAELQCTLDGEVVGLSGPAGPDDFFSTRTNQACDLRTPGFNRALGEAARPMVAGGIGEGISQKWLHGRQCFWSQGRGGGVVEIDHDACPAKPASTVRNPCTSSAVLPLPKLTRTAPLAVAASMPIASNTWLGSPLPLAQAEPLLTA